MLGIDFDYLLLWGHYRLMVQLHQRLRGTLTDPTLEQLSMAVSSICTDPLDHADPDEDSSTAGQACNIAPAPAHGNSWAGENCSREGGVSARGDLRGISSESRCDASRVALENPAPSGRSPGS
jgi:hypothetical protein